MNNSNLPDPLILLDRAATHGRLKTATVANLRDWLTKPGYRTAVPRIVELLQHEKFAELESLFWEVIPFGTGGRRGPMADIGSATLNARTVAESAAGIARYVREATGTATGRVVIAHDTRHRSAEFARLTACVFAAEGFTTFLFPSHRSTPALSFAVRHLKCDTGVMISASHNPPADNGVKAYWSHGGQVLPPHDGGIIRCVSEVGEIAEADFDAAVASGAIQLLDEAIDKAFIAAVIALQRSTARDLKVLYSPMHGVGETSVSAVLQAAGFQQVEFYEPQRTPDGSFPNVPRHLPNPELPAVFEPMIAIATDQCFDLILASDPDADRIGVMVRTSAGEFQYLTGNQIGALLCDFAVQQGAGRPVLRPQQYINTTLVTTPLVAAIGRAAGVRVIDEQLVGFKYIGATIEREGPADFLFACEESHGYLAGAYARDKDAAIGALWLCEAAAELKLQGKTLINRLDEIYVQHGYHAEAAHSETCRGADGKAAINRLMAALRTAPPRELAGYQLCSVRDYQQHEVRSLPANICQKALPEPQGDLLIFETQRGRDAIRFAARPSGTEPKIKFYLFARAGQVDALELPATKAATHAAIADFLAALRAWLAPFVSVGS